MHDDSLRTESFYLRTGLLSLRLGIPVVGIVILEAGLFAAVSIFSGILGPVPLATYQVMIAWVGIERYRLGLTDDMTLAARPRWPLDDTAAPMLGSGKKGAKA